MGEDAEPSSLLRLPLLVTDESLRLCLRAVTPADREAIQDGLRAISPETTYRRFFVPYFSPSDEELRYLTDVDGRDHVAIGAVDCRSDPPCGTGVARYVRLPDEPAVAEAAIVVRDAYQGAGIGSLLLAALNKRAADSGVRTFRGYVLVENREVIEVLRALNATETPTEERILQMDVPVYAHHTHLPDDPILERVHWGWRKIEAADPGDCGTISS